VCLLRVFLSVLTLGTFQLKSSCSSLTPTYLSTYLPTYPPTYLQVCVCVFYYFKILLFCLSGHHPDKDVRRMAIIQMKMWKEWQSSIRRCRKNGDHPYEDLAKSNYKPNVKYKSIINFLYIHLYTLKKQI